MLRCSHIALLFTFITAGAAVADDRDWHFLSVSSEGTVSLLRDLTKEECEFVKNRALGLPATEVERSEAVQRNKSISDFADRVCKSLNKDGTSFQEAFLEGDRLEIQCTGSRYNSVSMQGGPSEPLFKRAECFR